jgi:hypothetical protein
MRDSDTPVQPKRAKVKATMSVGVVGWAVSVVELKNVDGIRERICWMGGEG